mgnify:CR=1 FL=1
MFQNNIIDGEISNFNNGRIIIGKHLAIELGVVVGDKINLMSSTSSPSLFGMVPKQSSYKIISVFKKDDIQTIKKVLVTSINK